jgi:hypothetical protein
MKNEIQQSVGARRLSGFSILRAAFRICRRGVSTFMDDLLSQPLIAIQRPQQ